MDATTWTAIGVVVTAVVGAVSIWQVHRYRVRSEAADEADRAEERTLREQKWSGGPGRPSTAPEVIRIPGEARTYQFRVTNVGGEALLDLRPYLVDQEETERSDPLQAVYLDPLHPRDFLDFELTVRADVVDVNPLRLHYDYLGSSEGHRSNVTVPTH
jgi:hypothetical protein